MTPHKYGLVYIRFVGKHLQYDQIDLATILKEGVNCGDKTEADYEATLKEIERLFETEPGSPEGDRLEILTTLVEAYEEEHYHIPPPDPIEAIRYYMESRGLSRRELEPYLGSRARVSEILNRKRPLSLQMIRKLHNGLGIPAEVLIKPYEYDQAA